MSRKYPTFKGFEYLRKGVKYGVPPEIKFRGNAYKFISASLIKAMELKDEGKKILCLRIMKTFIPRTIHFYGAPIPNREILDEFFYVLT